MVGEGESVYSFMEDATLADQSVSVMNSFRAVNPNMSRRLETSGIMQNKSLLKESLLGRSGRNDDGMNQSTKILGMKPKQQ